MNQVITRIPTYDLSYRDPNEETLRQYVTKWYLDFFAANQSRPLIDVDVNGRGSYYSVKLFVTLPEQIPVAEEEAVRLQDELAANGFRTAITVYGWSTGT